MGVLCFNLPRLASPVVIMVCTQNERLGFLPSQFVGEIINVSFKDLCSRDLFKNRLVNQISTILQKKSHPAIPLLPFSKSSAGSSQLAVGARGFCNSVPSPGKGTLLPKRMQASIRMSVAKCLPLFHLF